MFSYIMNNLKEKKPLIHNITNYVTVNDCANIVLACGASPIMADDPSEMEDISMICSGLNLNLGTLNQRTVESMQIAGKCAARNGHPILLDPVGAGASKKRTETAKLLMAELPITVLRGNISELHVLGKGTVTMGGVDAQEKEMVSEENLGYAIEFAKEFSRKSGAVIAISGAIDLISDGKKTYIIRNGCKEMARVTGTGCMLSAMMCAYISANPDHVLEAAAVASLAMSVAGELAKERMGEYDGTGSFRTYLMDAVSNLTVEQLEKRGKIEMVMDKSAMLLYAVTDRSWLGDKTLYEQVEEALQGGVTIVQLREKNLSEDDFMKEAVQIRELCHKYNVPLIINDNVNLALECDADGVHVGQSDMDAKNVREILGPDKIIGVSARTLEQAKAAKAAGANYLGVGACFSTSTKKDANALNWDELKKITDQIGIPVVAIGGINENNIMELQGTGVDGVAVVSALFAKENVKAAAESMRRLSERMIQK